MNILSLRLEYCRYGVKPQTINQSDILPSTINRLTQSHIHVCIICSVMRFIPLNCACLHICNIPLQTARVFIDIRRWSVYTIYTMMYTIMYTTRVALTTASFFSDWHVNGNSKYHVYTIPDKRKLNIKLNVFHVVDHIYMYLIRVCCKLKRGDDKGRGLIRVKLEIWCNLDDFSKKKSTGISYRRTNYIFKKYIFL